MGFMGRLLGTNNIRTEYVRTQLKKIFQRSSAAAISRCGCEIFAKPRAQVLSHYKNAAALTALRLASVPACSLHYWLTFELR